MRLLFILAATSFIFSCTSSTNSTTTTEVSQQIPFDWDAATIYFLLTDRFSNGNTTNDVNFNRTKETAVLRGFKGGDIQGMINKVEDNYFSDLGINAIWFTPIVEQVHGVVNEGTGNTYGYHGYWAKDWTQLDPNFGTMEELKELVDKAHAKGIRIVLDGVINHTGPVTAIDPVWPNDWVRTGPTCAFSTYENTTQCSLVDNLPDILTTSEKEVELPLQLVEKWKAEGRYEKEILELDAFFERTGYPRLPKFYIIKWLTDYIAELGVDGYRADTVKHLEENVWSEFRTECDYAFNLFKKENPKKVIDNNAFYLVGEVYNYGVNTGKEYDFGDKKVNYFNHGFDQLINFDFKYKATESYESLFSAYDGYLANEMKGAGLLNYATSHDDGSPFDKDRTKPFETANKLLLCPGAAQVYYGDESARDLTIEGTNGDATLRSFMNWDDISSNEKTKEVLSHWQKLGRFRANHPSIGIGKHQMISESPYVFSRTYSKNDITDKVVVGLDLSKGEKAIPVAGVFEDGLELTDMYSGMKAKVKNGEVIISSDATVVLLQ